LGNGNGRTPIGVFRDVDRATYDEQAREQVAAAGEPPTDSRAALSDLLHAGDTWTVN